MKRQALPSHLLAIAAIAAWVPLSCGSKGSPPVASNSPLGGTVAGRAFTSAGATAESREGGLYVVIANEPLACGTVVRPNPALVLITLSLPANVRGAGVYELGLDTMSARVVATTYSAGTTGQLAQSSEYLRGTLTVESATDNHPAVGALTVQDQAGTSVAGRFDAVFCGTP